MPDWCATQTLCTAGVVFAETVYACVHPKQLSSLTAPHSSSEMKNIDTAVIVSALMLLLVAASECKKRKPCKW